MERVVVVATMADGTVIEEGAEGFAAFADLVLGFRADPECVTVTWRARADARRRAAAA